jgi:WD40 repeat protein
LYGCFLKINGLKRWSIIAKNLKLQICNICLFRKWSPDGKKICIIYFDGAIIIGGVDGSRHWGKEIKANLVKCDWSPDSKLLIFGTDKGTIAIYDS